MWLHSRVLAWHVPRPWGQFPDKHLLKVLLHAETELCVSVGTHFLLRPNPRGRYGADEETKRVMVSYSRSF